MATTTPNYGWTVPTSTDLVKDGATAIETLGDAIDASMNTALGTKKAGMVLLNTTSFSAVASQSINDVFSSTYSNYRIVFDCSVSTAASMSFRVRVSGSDLTTSTYRYGHYINAYNNTITGDGSGTATAWVIGYSNGLSFATFLDIANPQATKNTLGLYACAHDASMFAGGGLVNNTTSYTGFTIFSSAGTLTGTVRIYGYNN